MSPEPQGALKLEERFEPLDCPTHGQQRVRVFKLFDDWSPPRCPTCEADQEQARTDEEAARLRREAAEHRDRLIRKHLQHAAVPPRFEGKSFADYTASDPGATKALATCRTYADRFAEHLRAGTSLILCGNAGTGKTHLACAVANHVIREHAKAAVYMTAGRAFRRVKDTYRKNSQVGEQDALSAFAVPDLLILDEIGVQYGSDAERNILFEIVNERYEQMKPTALISNLALPALTDFAGERVIDRLKENGGKLVVFDWKSHRGAA